MSKGKNLTAAAFLLTTGLVLPSTLVQAHVFDPLHLFTKRPRPAGVQPKHSGHPNHHFLDPLHLFTKKPVMMANKVVHLPSHTYGEPKKLQGPETLNRVLMRAIHEHPEIGIRRAQHKQASEDLYEAKAGYLPVVDLNGELGRETSNNVNTRNALGETRNRTLTRRQGGASATENLFEGGRTYYTVEGRKESLVSARSLEHEARNQVGLAIIESYLNVLRENRLMTIARGNVQAHLKSFKTIKDRAQSGVSRKTEEDQANARLALARSNLQAEQNNYNDAQAGYVRNVGYLPGKLVKPRFDDRWLPKTLASAIDRAIAHNPLLSSARHDLASSRHLYLASQAPFYPTADFVVNGNWGEDLDGVRGINYDNNVLLRLSYNVFRGGADFARMKKAAYQKMEASEALRDVERRVIENVRLAWYALQANRRQLQDQYRHMVLSRKTIKAYREQFELGKRTLIDLLNAKNEYFNAGREYTTGEYDVLRDKYRLLAAMGELADQLGLYH